jgi:hypothetical protein
MPAALIPGSSRETTTPGHLAVRSAVRHRPQHSGYIVRTLCRRGHELQPCEVNSSITTGRSWAFAAATAQHRRCNQASSKRACHRKLCAAVLIAYRPGEAGRISRPVPVLNQRLSIMLDAVAAGHGRFGGITNVLARSASHVRSRSRSTFSRLS